MLVFAALAYAIIVGIVMFALALAASDGSSSHSTTDHLEIDEIEQYANRSRTGDTPGQPGFGRHSTTRSIVQPGG